MANPDSSGSVRGGVNRIVPTISIPYPLGDPATPKEVQHKLRYHRVGVRAGCVNH